MEDSKAPFLDCCTKYSDNFVDTALSCTLGNCDMVNLDGQTTAAGSS